MKEKQYNYNFILIAVLVAVLIGGVALFLSLDTRYKLETSSVLVSDLNSLNCEIIGGTNSSDPTRGITDIAHCEIIGGTNSSDPTRYNLSIIPQTAPESLDVRIEPEMITPFESVLHIIGGTNSSDPTKFDAHIITGADANDPSKVLTELQIIGGTNSSDPTKTVKCGITNDSVVFATCEIIGGTNSSDPTKFDIIAESMPEMPIQLNMNFMPTPEGGIIQIISGQ